MIKKQHLNLVLVYTMKKNFLFGYFLNFFLYIFQKIFMKKILCINKTNTSNVIKINLFQEHKICHRNQNFIAKDLNKYLVRIFGTKRRFKEDFFYNKQIICYYLFKFILNYDIISYLNEIKHKMYFNISSLRETSYLFVI